MLQFLSNFLWSHAPKLRIVSKLNSCHRRVSFPNLLRLPTTFFFDVSVDWLGKHPSSRIWCEQSTGGRRTLASSLSRWLRWPNGAAELSCLFGMRKRLHSTIPFLQFFCSISFSPTFLQQHFCCAESLGSLFFLFRRSHPSCTGVPIGLLRNNCIMHFISDARQQPLWSSWSDLIHPISSFEFRPKFQYYSQVRFLNHGSYMAWRTNERKTPIARVVEKSLHKG